MTNAVQFMKKTWEQWQDRYVRVVAFPLPPTPVDSVIYMPDSFMSRVFDMDFKFDHSEEFEPIMIKTSKWGPAILAQVRLKSVIAFDPITGFLKVPHSTLCASVSSYGKTFRDSGLVFATEVSINKVTLRHRSCHPGSHWAVPEAPFLTALLQYAQAPADDNDEHRVVTTEDKCLQIDYSTPEEARLLYPHWAFSKNAEVDRYLGGCVVDAKMSWWNLSGGVGRWAQPYLTQLRRNILLKEHEREQKVERRDEVPGNARQEDDRASDGQRIAVSGETAR